MEFALVRGSYLYYCVAEAVANATGAEMSIGLAIA
uniref:Uncharacterized protein n=1 Tax=Melanopsichium pennsylvanicum 4 TaxID=1398559 RepID=A0A077QV49_9BASI|nr:uncharacterized protein BN887_06138 [Melanopsichium pennsylvanicum 4]